MLYADPYVEALNFGDADGVAYEEIARTRSAVGTALAAFGEDQPCRGGVDRAQPWRRWTWPTAR